MEVSQKINLAEVIARLDAMDTAIKAFGARIEALEQSAKATNKSEREMTDDDARRILNGDLKDMKHNDAAKALNLSYGQVYSCRLEYTFRHIHKELSAAGWKNPFKTKK